jgi:transketolase
MIASIAGEGQVTRPRRSATRWWNWRATGPNVVGMTADLGKYTDLHLFAKEFPERFYQMGMAEQLLMGAAAGMAHEGAQPFVTTYAVFAARRAYDFIHQAIAEDNLDVKIVCALPGLTTGYGPSHQATEDLALFRAMPNMTVIDPCDALEIEQMVPAIAAHQGPGLCAPACAATCRSCSTNTTTVRTRQSQAAARRRRSADHLVRHHDDARARRAKALENGPDRCGVLHVPTIKPLDTETILREARRRGGWWSSRRTTR